MAHHSAHRTVLFTAYLSDCLGGELYFIALDTAADLHVHDKSAYQGFALL